MAYFDTTWYVNFGNGTSTGYYAVPLRPQNTVVVAGQLCRQFTTPAVSNERVFICTVAGTTANTTDATWTLGRGGITTDGTAKWIECSGLPGLNGDSSNTLSWSQIKALGSPNAGTLIKRNNGASYQIVTAGGAALSASEPAFSDTAGVTTTDASVTWTSLGPVTNFTGGQAPHARLANALTANWFTSGNTVYVGDNHAETNGTGVILTPVGSDSIMSRVLCHNHSGPYPPTGSDLAATATLTVTGGSTGTVFGGSGAWYLYGLTFSNLTWYTQIGSATASANNWYYCDRCSFQLGSTGHIYLDSNANSGVAKTVIFNNTTVKFGTTSQGVIPHFAQFIWQNTAPILAPGSFIPTILFPPAINAIGRLNSVVLEGLDLSQITGTLFSNAGQSSVGNFLIKDCKLNPAATIVSSINTGQVVQNSRSSGAATPYVSSRHTYEAIETTETSIVRSGGFADPTGQKQSRKIATSVNPQWLRPYKAEPYAAWNSVVGSSVVATVYGLAGIGTQPNNDDVWLELQYLGSGSSSLGSVATTGKAQVWSANAAVPSDGSSWNMPPTAYDPTRTINVTLSNGNLTVLHSTGNAGVCVAGFFSGGKFYFEGKMVIAGPFTMGLVVSTGSASDAFSASTTIGVLTGAGTSSVYVNGTQKVSTLGGTVVGDVFGFAIDLTNRLVWVRRNNGNWNADASANPATGTNGLAFTAGAYAPVMSFVNGNSGESATANFGATAFANAAPSGFLSWDAGWIPFKLTTNFTPNLPGYILGRVRAAKPSTTFYIDPKLELVLGAVTPDAAPVNTVLPLISGTPTEGETLVTTDGTWTGYPNPTYGYQWKRNGTAISGATASSYLLVTADVGTTITVTVTATNRVAGVAATAVGVGPVAPLFTPAALTGLIGWWDASVTASLTLSGADILSVADQSGAGNTMNWTGFGKPTYSATNFNGVKPAIMFDAIHIGSAMQITSFPMGTGNTLTWFYVGMLDRATASVNGRLFSYTGAGQTQEWNNANSWVACRINNDLLQFTRQGNVFPPTNTPLTENVYHRVIGTIDPTGILTAYVDGVFFADTTSPGNWTSPGLLEFGRSASSNQYWGGPIGEAGVATGYSDGTKVGQLDAYLKKKWGL